VTHESALYFAWRFTAVFICASFLFSIATFAGPPLICHVFEIGNAKSLRWISRDWDLTGAESYDTKNLASDTLAILNSDPTVVVHMETLRRATLYARKDPIAAKQLLTKLLARAEATSDSAQAALANFDAGYLVETYKQWIGKDEPNPALGLDGYTLVRKAIRMQGDDAQMEFAAALITLQRPQSDHEYHAQRAIAGAKSDALLAQNLSLRFHGAPGQTMAELISSGPRLKTGAKQ
jgi:hypothetical protein